MQQAVQAKPVKVQQIETWEGTFRHRKSGETITGILLPKGMKLKRATDYCEATNGWMQCPSNMNNLVYQGDKTRWVRKIQPKEEKKT